MRKRHEKHPTTSLAPLPIPRGPRMSTQTVKKTEQAVVEAKDVVAGYIPGVNILNGCSLVAYPGEMIGIIGPNGAGKSTVRVLKRAATVSRSSSQRAGSLRAGPSSGMPSRSTNSS